MVNIRICVGTSCHLNGARNVLASFQHLIEVNKLHDKVKLEAAFCDERCDKSGVSVSVDGTPYRVEADKAHEFFRNTVIPLTVNN